MLGRRLDDVDNGSNTTKNSYAGLKIHGYIFRLLYSDVNVLSALC